MAIIELLYKNIREGRRGNQEWKIQKTLATFGYTRQRTETNETITQRRKLKRLATWTPPNTGGASSSCLLIKPSKVKELNAREARTAPETGNEISKYYHVIHMAFKVKILIRNNTYVRLREINLKFRQVYFFVMSSIFSLS